LKKFIFILILCSPVLAEDDLRLRPVTEEIIEKLREDSDLYFEDKDGDGLSGDYFYIDPIPDDEKTYILDGNRQWKELKDASEKELEKYREAYRETYGKDIPEEKVDPAIKANPLEVAEKEMRNSANSLQKDKIESAIKSQKQAIAALKEFLRRQEGDQNNNNKNRNRNNQNKRRRQQKQQSGQKPGQQQSSPGKGQTPAQSATGGSASNTAQKSSRSKMEVKIWGQLKDKIEESDRTNVAKDRFLPIYSDKLEDYFEQLSRKKLRRN